jgi:manganese transport protein
MPRRIIDGPGVFIACAILGPSTITICLTAGIFSGLDLLWLLTISTFAVAVLQDMCLRLTYFGKTSLDSVLLNSSSKSIIKILYILLIFITIIFQNIVLESGNFQGASLGLKMLNVNIDQNYTLFFLFTFCLTLFVFSDNYLLLKRVLLVLCLIIFLAFFMLLVIHFPKVIDVFEGLFLPALKKEHLYLLFAIIGTTLIPYNLFLHSSLALNAKNVDIKSLRINSLFWIFFSGFISFIIITVGFDLKDFGVIKLSDIAILLENTHQLPSKYLLGIGLFASGLASALVVGYTIGLILTSLLGWNKKEYDWKRKTTIIMVLSIGFTLAIQEIETISLLKNIQTVNAIFFPLIVGYLIYKLNDRSLLKVHKNSLSQNIISIVVLFVSIFLSLQFLMT